MMDEAEPTPPSLKDTGERQRPSQTPETHQDTQPSLEIDRESVHLIIVDGPLEEQKLSEITLPTKFFLLAISDQNRRSLTYIPGMRSFKRDRIAAYELIKEYACCDLDQALQNLGAWRRSLISEADQYLEIVDEITVVHGEVMPERLYGCWRLCTDYYLFVLKIQPKLLILYRPGRILLPWLPNGEPSGWNTVAFGSEFHDLDSALRYTRAWKQKEAERWSTAIKQYGRCPNHRRKRP